VRDTSYCNFKMLVIVQEHPENKIVEMKENIPNYDEYFMKLFKKVFLPGLKEEKSCLIKIKSRLFYTFKSKKMRKEVFTLKKEKKSSCRVFQIRKEEHPKHDKESMCQIIDSEDTTPMKVFPRKSSETKNNNPVENKQEQVEKTLLTQYINNQLMNYYAMQLVNDPRFYLLNNYMNFQNPSPYHDNHTMFNNENINQNLNFNLNFYINPNQGRER